MAVNFKDQLVVATLADRGRKALNDLLEKLEGQGSAGTGQRRGTISTRERLQCGHGAAQRLGRYHERKRRQVPNESLLELLRDDRVQRRRDRQRLEDAVDDAEERLRLVRCVHVGLACVSRMRARAAGDAQAGGTQRRGKLAAARTRISTGSLDTRRGASFQKREASVLANASRAR